VSWSYLHPVLPLFLVGGIAGLVRAWRSRANGKPWLLTIGIVGCFLISWDPVACLLYLPLESQYKPLSALPEEAQAIVVLSGNVYPPTRDRPYPSAGEDTYLRCQYAAWLYKCGLTRPVLACGGGNRTEPFSITMRKLLISEGVPPDRIWVETRSQSTHENAVYGAQLLRSRGISRIALVAEAFCMPRAAACFRKEGLTVFPAPFAFGRLLVTEHDLLPNWRALQVNGETIHEFGGLLWYRLRGWI
jgi:uncharacterized SAM-binding protein YcdF (DUF218 family)